MPIVGAIPQQNFEKIRDQIAVVLGIEFIDKSINVGIWVERFIPFDKNELPALKIFYDNSSFTKDSPCASKGESKYIVEISVNQKSTSSSDGDKSAAIEAQGLAGKIRYILEHTIYKTLTFELGFIEGVEVVDIITAVPAPNDSLYTYTLNLVFNVRHKENNGLEAPTQTVSEVHSAVKLEETEKGYKIVKTN